MDKRKKAAALSYQPDKDKAPRLTAKGTGLLAERIIEVARLHGVPIREDPDLVETLAQLDWQEHIPASLYQAVAEVLAFVYRLNEQRKTAGPPTAQP
ncbi:MAG: EscU/YscU/HrcU family type III secretion system export apparatus switch protein [Deltaproteobacteria bacterium]|nr:EscU/YscU/HrcU family type III secretion system export apparatus switch protein [Deltaproteobacteria bacterium]MBW2069706.1 EscU/YscU/HrcU family type III secretion system export apparatus switch protein [Deltaproteobacteria bacterium]